MKKTFVFSVILTIFLSACSKEEAQPKSAVECDNPQVVQMLKNQVLQSKSLCKDPKDELDLYCQIEKGEFKNFKITGGNNTHNSCYVEYDVGDGIGFIFNYEVRLDNEQPISVSILDHDEAIGIQ
ncbi:MAG: hypothetical protein J6M43_00595 [Neisseriaceae bacterium]|nr:hypothetical protein [Neisseriaceae bacterium]